MAALSAALLLGTGASAGLPEEGQCPVLTGVADGGEGVSDAYAVPMREGMVLDLSGVLALRNLLPEEVWRNRDAFFFEGMRMEIGPCHRRYPVPGFYREATEKFAGQPTLDDEGNLRDYVAGIPFPPEKMDEGDKRNGTRWAWNLAHRWRGAGPVGDFRLVDMPSRLGSVETFKGNFFFLQTGHRSDLAESDFALPESHNNVFIAGGKFTDPQNARHLAWRQMRPLEAETRYEESDDIFVYVPEMRKMRRAASAWVDGMYTPRYRVGGQAAGGGLAVGSDVIPNSGAQDVMGGIYAAAGAAGMGGPQASIQPTSGLSAAITEHLRRGFDGMALRPNAYLWRVVGEREVIAPLNASRSGYPIDPERNFGPSGLSVASDRWEVRYAVVLQGRARERGGEFDMIYLWMDYQTLQPLYLITRRGRGALVDVGILVHRFSGDQHGYPPWPDGQKAFVFDPVAAVFYAGDQSGWRRESYDIRSVPADETEHRRFLSSDFLLRGR